MRHQASAEDIQFRAYFEAHRIAPSAFDHGAHVRLAYVYLCEGSIDDASGKMKAAILSFLAFLGADSSKYHETMTRAWVMAVDHFMKRSATCTSYSQFASVSPPLLDSKIMLTHYSAETLFSPTARAGFVEPDIQSIPPPSPSSSP